MTCLKDKLKQQMSNELKVRIAARQIPVQFIKCMSEQALSLNEGWINLLLLQVATAIEVGKEDRLVKVISDFITTDMAESSKLTDTKE